METSKDWKPAFLKRLAQTGNVSSACRLVGIDRTTAYLHRKSDHYFALQWKEAEEEATDSMELEARRRAQWGIPRKKFTARGEPVIDPETGEQYEEREYSDGLLMFLLKAHRPEKFRERYDLRHGGLEDGTPIPFVIHQPDAKPPGNES